MTTRQNLDLLKRLRESPTFKRAIQTARTEEEKASIRAAAEQLVGRFSEVFTPLYEQLHDNPLLQEQLARKLVDDHVVVTANEPSSSGSIG